MRIWLAVSIVLMLAVSGCFGNSNSDEEPVLPPEPTIQEPPQNVTLPPAMLTGRVLGPDGPLSGALVYIETVNLTAPVNNIADYIKLKNATLQTTTDGSFSFLWNQSYQRVAVRAAGMTPWVSQNLSVPANETIELMVTLQPASEKLVTAHRGGAMYAPANSLSALHKAGLLGIPRAEIDIHWTLDEVFVVWHDGPVDDPDGQRMWMQNSDDATDREIGSEFHASFANETVPTLAEALEVMAMYGTIPVVEVKITDDPRHAAMMAAAMEEITAAGLADLAVIISFDPTYAIQCGQGGLLCGYIEGNPEGVRTDPGFGKDIMGQFLIEHHMPQEIVTQEYVQESHDAGLLVTAWTVNDVDASLALVEQGVDAITTDMPWEIMQALA